MKLWQFARKNVEITLKNGQIISGYVQDYCDGFDSLSVDIDGTLYEYFENEIKSIKMLGKSIQKNN